MRPLGGIALGEYGPWELFEAAQDVRINTELEFEDGREETALLFEQFAWTLVDIIFLEETE